MSVTGTILGIAANAGMGMLNQQLAGMQAERDRYQNYKYGEMAAENADRRTRDLYSDIYSPGALTRQYNKAGLSPSAMYGGMPGAGGSSGASASGSASVQTPFMPISLLEGAQIANIQAQTAKTQEETKNIIKDTDLKELQEEWQQMQNAQYKTQFTLMQSGFQMPNGEIKSYYDVAGDYKDFDKFIKACRDAAVEAGDQGIIQSLASEQGLKVMRNIYKARHEFSRDISILSSEKVNAEFTKSVLKAMNEEGFPEWNAKAGLAYLKQTVESAKLDESQKKAWNDLIDKLKAKNDTMADAVIILGMIVNQAMTAWHMPALNVNNNYRTNTTTNNY